MRDLFSSTGAFVSIVVASTLGSLVSILWGDTPWKVGIILSLTVLALFGFMIVRGLAVRSEGTKKSWDEDYADMDFIILIIGLVTVSTMGYQFTSLSSLREWAIAPALPILTIVGWGVSVWVVHSFSVRIAESPHKMNKSFDYEGYSIQVKSNEIGGYDVRAKGTRQVLGISIPVTLYEQSFNVDRDVEEAVKKTIDLFEWKMKKAEEKEGKIKKKLESFV